MRVAVYGNLIYDQLITLETPLTPGASHNCQMGHSTGGIANFCRAGVGHFDMTVISKIGKDEYGIALTDDLKEIATLEVAETSEPTTVATVIVDKATSTRTGLVRWGACRNIGGWHPVHSDWRHLMYLDRMMITIDELKLLGGCPISADFCTIEDVDSYRHLLPYIDYLIVSEHQCKFIMHMDLPVRKGVIVHSPQFIYYKILGKIDSYRVNVESGLNVVGAGDYFAAFTIANLLKDKLSNLKLIHEQTIEMLKRQS